MWLSHSKCSWLDLKYEVGADDCKMLLAGRKPLEGINLVWNWYAAAAASWSVRVWLCGSRRGLIKPALPPSKPCKSGEQPPDRQKGLENRAQLLLLCMWGALSWLNSPVLLATLLRPPPPTVKREHFLFVVSLLSRWRRPSWLMYFWRNDVCCLFYAAPSSASSL